MCPQGDRHEQGWILCIELPLETLGSCTELPFNRFYPAVITFLKQNSSDREDAGRGNLPLLECRLSIAAERILNASVERAVKLCGSYS
jgi:hypothetical protein